MKDPQKPIMQFLSTVVQNIASDVEDNCYYTDYNQKTHQIPKEHYKDFSYYFAAGIAAITDVTQDTPRKIVMENRQSQPAFAYYHRAEEKISTYWHSAADYSQSIQSGRNKLYWVDENRAVFCTPQEFVVAYAMEEAIHHHQNVSAKYSREEWRKNGIDAGSVGNLRKPIELEAKGMVVEYMQANGFTGFVSFECDLLKDNTLTMDDLRNQVIDTAHDPEAFSKLMDNLRQR